MGWGEGVSLMNLNKLRTFIHVVESGSISQAAQDLFRTQPAISSALKDLEAEIGLKLFERRNARIFVTPEGKDLYEYSCQRIRELDDKADRLRSDLRELSGTIRLGILNDFSSFISADLIVGFRQQFPRVKFQLHSWSTEAMEVAMLEGELDFAMMVGYEQRELFDRAPVYEFQREPMAAPSYLKRVAAITAYEDLLNMDLLGLGPRLGSFRFWYKKNGKGSLESVIDKIVPAVTADDIRDFNSLIVSGLGIGLCYRELVQTELNRRQLVRLFPDAKPLQMILDISRRKTRSNSLLMERFWDYMVTRGEAALSH